MVERKSGSYNICDFGAVSGGEALCSAPIKQAIEACSNNGGGTVYVPAGLYLTGAIHLKSNINLYLEAGAILKFSQDVADYPEVYSRWEGVERNVYSPLIYGRDLQNVSITGRGTLDGHGEPWWKLYRSKQLEKPRPRFIGMDHCHNVLIEGITLINSPSWTVNPVCCENVTIEKITILNPADSPNTDGIDPDSCRNVHIANCHIDVGDDCIVIKSGTEENRWRVPCENITITNCTMAHGHGGVVIGSEMSGGVRNVAISNCIFEGTDRGIRLKSRRGRGGVVEDIRVNNVVMTKVITPFAFNLYYYCGPGGKAAQVADKAPYPVSEATPVFRSIHLSNITAREVYAAAGFLYGLPEQPISDVSFDNISIYLSKEETAYYPEMLSGQEPLCRYGFFICNLQNGFFNNIKISGNKGAAFVVKQSTKIDLAHCACDNVDPEDREISLEHAEQITINRNCVGEETGRVCLE